MRQLWGYSQVLWGRRMVFALVSSMLYATDTYGTYSMPGSWSDGDTFAGAHYDGNGSGDDAYGVSFPLPPPTRSYEALLLGTRSLVAVGH